MTRAARADELDQGDAVLADLGHHVRASRKAAGLTRARLAEASGVSQRYLAQLEGGQGNISVALLTRVADALGLTPAALLARPQQADITGLFEAAPTAVQDQVLSLLSPDGRAAKARRLCLVGLRGAGKSTLGAGLGARLGLPFLELKSVIENAAGMPQSEIIALYGSDGFRRYEAEALDHVVTHHEAVVLAVAGGIVAEAETYARLMTRFHTVWIRATPEAHMSRVLAQGDTRPMEGAPDALDRIRAILEDRGRDYARADATLDTTGATPEESLDALATLVRTRGLLAPD